MSLTLAEAERVVQAALGKARALGIDVSVAVVRRGRAAGGLRPHGRGQLGRRVRLTGEGGGRRGLSGRPAAACRAGPTRR